MTSKPILPKQFKLERNTVIYSRFLAGESRNKLARAYGFRTSYISRMVKNYKRYIDLGVIPPVKPYED